MDADDGAIPPEQPQPPPRIKRIPARTRHDDTAAAPPRGPAIRPAADPNPATAPPRSPQGPVARPETDRDQRPPTSRDVHSPTSREGRSSTTRDAGVSAGRDHRGYRPADGVAVSAIRLPDYLERDYDIVEDLDSGGEANVAVIRGRRDGTRKVVKIYHHGIALPQAFVDKLTTADPRHVLPVIRSTYDRWARPRFIEVMDYLPDGSLETLLSQAGGRAPDLAREVLVEMTNALAYIHERLGIVHRDIKPANILIRRRRPLDLVLADLGIAAELAVSRRSRRETTGGIKGTLVYQSPETLNTADAGKSRDWWALGMTLCEVLSGQHPFKDGRGQPLSDENAIRHAITMGAIDLTMIGDQRWNLLCRGLLVHDPADRWGAPQVRAWLAGESPPVAVSRPTGVRPDRTVPAFRFAGQRFTDPADLATHMVTHWDDAVSLFMSKQDCDALRAWIREDVGDPSIDTNLLTPVGGAPSLIDARILEFAAHYRGSDVIFRGASITAQDLVIRYLQADESWEHESVLAALTPEVLDALVQTQFAEDAGPHGQSGEYYALARLSRYAGEADQRIDAAAGGIVSAVSVWVAGTDVGVDVREAMPHRIARARAVARAALLSPACLEDVRTQFGRLDRRGPQWFGDLCARAESPQPHDAPGCDGAPANSVDVDAAEIAYKALALGVADLAGHYEHAHANAEAAEKRQSREAQAAEKADARRILLAERRKTTLHAVGAAVITVAGLVGHIRLTPQIPAGDEWPYNWMYALLNWPSAQTQQIALVIGIAALIALMLLINLGDFDIKSPRIAIYCAIAYCGISLLPLAGALLSFALLLALGAAVAIFIAFFVFAGLTD